MKNTKPYNAELEIEEKIRPLFKVQTVYIVMGLFFVLGLIGLIMFTITFDWSVLW